MVEAAPRHWRLTRLVTIGLLAVWFGVSFVLVFFARELELSVLGWPLGFWIAAQGAPLVYLLLVWLYSRTLARLDRECASAEPAQK